MIRLTTEQAARRTEAIHIGMEYGLPYFDACQMADFYIGLSALPRHKQVYVVAIMQWAAIKARISDAWRSLLHTRKATRRRE